MKLRLGACGLKLVAPAASHFRSVSILEGERGSRSLGLLPLLTCRYSFDLSGSFGTTIRRDTRRRAARMKFRPPSAAPSSPWHTKQCS